MQGTENKLLSAIASDCEDPLLLSVFRALGIVDKLITGPLMRILEAPSSHTLAFNTMWLQVIERLENLSHNARPLLEEYNVVTGSLYIHFKASKFCHY